MRPHEIIAQVSKSHYKPFRAAFDFPDWLSFREACHAERAYGAGDVSGGGTDYHPLEWYGDTVNLEDADAVALTGSPKLEARAKVLAETLTAGIRAPRSIGFETTWDVAGDEPDICRYLEGEPENMMVSTPFERVGGGRIVTLVINGGAGMDVDRDQIERRGAAVLALIDLLENSGMRAELKYVSVTERLNRNTAFRITLKESEDTLDLARLAYCLAHPAMLRRHIFRMRETVRGATGDCYGSTKNILPAQWEIDSETEGHYIQTNDWSSFGSDERARHWISDRLKQFGMTEGE